MRSFWAPDLIKGHYSQKFITLEIIEELLCDWGASFSGDGYEAVLMSHDFLNSQQRFKNPQSLVLWQHDPKLKIDDISWFRWVLYRALINKALILSDKELQDIVLYLIVD